MAKSATKAEKNENEELKVTDGESPEVTEQENPSKKKEEKTYTAAEVEALVKSVSEKAQDAVAAYIKSQGEQPVVEIKKDEYVTLLYMDAVSDTSVLTLGKLGQINRVGGTLDIPKKEFFQGIDAKVDKLMRRRELIVINGLTDEERSRYRLDYKEGELLSADMYYKLLDLDVKVLYEIFPKLCESHQRIVAKLFISAYEDGDNRIHPDTVKVLNNLSKKTDPDGMFTPILKDMGRKLSE